MAAALSREDEIQIAGWALAAATGLIASHAERHRIAKLDKLTCSYCMYLQAEAEMKLAESTARGYLALIEDLARTRAREASERAENPIDRLYAHLMPRR